MKTTRCAVRALALLAALGAGPALAGGPPLAPPDDVLARGSSAADPDTSLDQFLGGLSDSTDRYFGITAAPRDTAGLDSALAYGLAHPRGPMRTRGLRPSLAPSFAFNRVEGPVWGGAVGIGQARRLGQISGEIRYAAGPNLWLGGGGYRKGLRWGEAWWSARLFAGRSTAGMDRDRVERHLSSLRALVAGKDHGSYYRRDGFEVGIERETRTWRAGVGYRDMLESPLATTTTWNLAGRVPAVIENLPAALGRTRELELAAAARLPFVPVTVQLTHQTSGRALGSDFEYRRWRVAIAGELGLGRIATAVPQLSYGRLAGGAVPQEAFYLGGPHSLRSLPDVERGGTGMALARLDVIGATDVLAWAHVPHPAALPIQVGLFAAAGAVWGPDPYGGASVRGVDWPHPEAWASEVGASLLYQPGIPDPTGFLRLSYAHPLGPNRESTHWTLSYTRAIDLLKPVER